MEGMADTKVIVGSSLEEAGARFVDTWERLQRGEKVQPQRIISFESFEAFMRVMTPARFEVLKHLRQHPERSIKALAEALHRGYGKVHADIVALEGAGLVERAEGSVRATADKVLVEV